MGSRASRAKWKSSRSSTRVSFSPAGCSCPWGSGARTPLIDSRAETPLATAGFIQMITGRGEAGTFPDVSSCTALQMTVKADQSYAGYRVSFGTVHLPEGHHAYGYKADFDAPEGVYDDVVIPFTSFSAKWNEGTGDTEVSCEENKDFCPNTGTLQNMETLAIWGEGKEGSVRLSVKSISAVGCSGDTSSITTNEVVKMEEASVPSSSASAVSIENFEAPSLAWTSLNDPVMGGQSAGTVEIRDGVGIFDGEVVEVPFLHAPGFIKMVGSGAFPDVSTCASLQMTLMAEEEYEGYRVSFGTVQLPEMRYSRGYHADFQAPVGDYGSVSVPFNEFSAKWDPGTGNQVVSCEDDSQYCPDENTLKNMETLSIWGEGVAGAVRLKVKSISAVNCTGDAPSFPTYTSMKATSGSVEKARPNNILDNENLSKDSQKGADSKPRTASLWAIGGLVGSVAFIASVVLNLARPKKRSYAVVQDASTTRNEII